MRDEPDFQLLMALMDGNPTPAQCREIYKFIHEQQAELARQNNTKGMTP